MRRADPASERSKLPEDCYWSDCTDQNVMIWHGDLKAHVFNRHMNSCMWRERRNDWWRQLLEAKATDFV